ncbi:16S rRNA (uracil(1498)-N(3))-methyltransferase [Parapedobacter tibetensis]|uniref:16S rRNA (uracil(1498)-N(3))-methyltransferase n=1 Tax=Parapedobacter tibetensis TaxID=2972951 RepID=UPI00214D26A6|nr:16S rRNA (uracil(1498)-N(3))-methyltransferase [Parapedobacter tibetensis]
MQLFYTPEILPQHKAFVLNEEESKHAIRVLRLSSGQQINLVDGRGGRYTAVIMDAHPKRTVLEIVDVSINVGKRPYYLHIAIAPTKNIDRVEWFLEKATEVGIDEITPIICEHSERKDIRLDRLNKVMVSAMKQSMKAYHPKLNESMKFTEFIGAASDGQKFIAHCADSDKAYPSQLAHPSDRYTILVGPEGDFSASEIAGALSAGYQAITLGDSRLRTETAALVACVEVAMLNR